MKQVPIDGFLAQLNDVLGQLFRAHGVESTPRDGWLTFPGRDRLANAQIVREVDNPNALIVQLDVRLKLGDGRTLIESVAGWGPDLGAAVNQALNQFTAGTFHVLLASFFGVESPDHIERTEVVIGGRPRRVTAGNLTWWGYPPKAPDGTLDVRWLPSWRDLLAAQELPEGTHWVRLYYCRSKGGPVQCEVLLDNAPWTPLQNQTAALAWPDGDPFYSVRWFMVVEDRPPGGTG